MEIICLRTVTWFHKFLFHIDNFQTDLFEPEMGPYQVLPLRVRVEQEIMITKERYTFFRGPEMEPHQRTRFDVDRYLGNVDDL